jgi:hypothetical protein
MWSIKTNFFHLFHTSFSIFLLWFAEYPQEKAVRRLTLAAKTVQTIANFSKFGGKELYMSFDRMNKFVDEHTILMKGFLRSISTSSVSSTSSTANGYVDVNGYEYAMSSNTIQKFSSSTSPESSSPQTPLSTSRSSLNTNNNMADYSDRYKKEMPFNSDLIDLGKQLSILHSILVSIIAGLDQVAMRFFLIFLFTPFTDFPHKGQCRETTVFKRNPH